MKLPLNGIIPPLVTPLINDSTIDKEGLKKLIEHIIAGGVHGVFLLGTTGEAPNLSYKLRKEFVKTACALINKRIPVLVGITDTCMEGSLEMAEYAKRNGADAVVIASPYYLPIDESEFIEYLKDLVPQLQLPFLLYNMPSCTKLHMSVETVKKARDLGAIGIKDSSGNMDYFNSLIKAFTASPEFSIIIGTEVFLPETIINGGHGGVVGGANFFPRLFVDLYEASVAEDEEKIERLREKVIMIGKTIYDVISTSSRHIKTTKTALSALGICSDYVAHPFRKSNETETKLIKQNIKAFKL